MDKYSDIIIDRRGEAEESNMTTVNIIGEIKPESVYKLTSDGLKKVEREVKVPPHVILEGEWYSDELVQLSNGSNILGDNGIFSTETNQLVIPVMEATEENLKYYNCRLLGIDDEVEFQTNGELPITVVEIGKNYVEEYLYGSGHGSYLEYHKTPHYHRGMNEEARGYLVVGKWYCDEESNEDEYFCKIQLSAVKIPFGKAVYMSPFVVHTDQFLIGKYEVVYTKSVVYSTVTLKRKDNGLLPVKIGV